MLQNLFLSLVVLLNVAATRPVTRPAADEVQFSPHPRLILPDSELPRVRERVEKYGWAKTAFADLKTRSDGWLEKKIELPDRGGQWSHYYACKKCGTRLRTDSPTRHVCPACEEVYSGWPYDDVAISRRHNDFADAARDLGLTARITGENRYAEKGKEILLAYADRYLTYELHNNKGEKKIGGGRALSQSLSEATWLIKLLHAADLVWNRLKPDEIERLKTKLFYPAAVEVIQKHELKIHNIQCWKNAAVGLTGFLFEDRALISHAIDGEYGFVNQLARGVTDDGTWEEGAWGYHFYTANALAPLAEAARINGINLYTPRYKSMFTAPIAMAMPDGKLPAFNDSGTSTARGQEIYELALARFNDPTLARAIPTTQRSNITALLHGVEPLPEPPVTDFAGARTYDACGYALLQSGPDTNATWLCLKYGPHGGWHGHPDKLSFVLYSKGRILADDAGVFPYGVPVYREWAKTTIAHNTLAIGESNQQEASGACRAMISTPAHSAVLLEGGDALKDARFYRAAFLLGKDLIVFIDTVHDLSDADAPAIDLAYHPQGKWIAAPSAKPIEMPNKPGYMHLKEMRSIVTRDALSLVTESAAGRSRVTFAPAGTESKREYLIGTGVGRNVNDRVPVVIARDQQDTVTYIWAIETTAADQPPELREQPVSDASTTVQVNHGGKSWTLAIDPDARPEKQRLRITPAP